MVMDAAIGGDSNVVSDDFLSQEQGSSVDDPTAEISIMSEGSVLDDQLASDANLPTSPALNRFTTADEVEQFIVSQAVEQWKDLFGTEVSRGYGGPPVYGDYATQFVEPNVLDGKSIGPLESFQSAVGRDVFRSETNVQVAGVDEADLFKTDGKYLYIVREQRLIIIDVQDPREMKVVSRVTLDQPASQLYLDGDRLTVISQPSLFMPLVARPRAVNRMVVDSIDVFDGWQDVSWQPQVQIGVFDVRDRAAPREISRIQIDGSLVQSRSVGDHVVLVTQDDVSLPHPKLSCTDAVRSRPRPFEPVSSDWNRMVTIWPQPLQTCVYETEENYVARVSDGLLAKILPRYTSHDTSVNAIDPSSRFVTEPENIVATGLMGSQLISVTILDVGAETPSVIDSTGVLAPNAVEVYATAEHVYVAASEWSELGETTHLVQFSLGEASESAQVSAIGSVAGHLLNQFAMDEHEGYLRVATSQGFGETAANSVFVLQSQGKQLAVMGSVTGITPGESIVAARFLGDQAFLVTFQRIDPLVTLDLSDPTHPRVAGELEIPGFSNYLHPLADGYLIGLGRDADSQTGWATDPQISLFQVGNLADPVLLDRETIAAGAHAWSPGFSDHHAIRFFESAGIFAVPFNLPEWESGQLLDSSNWNAETVIERIGIPQIQLAVNHFAGQLDPKGIWELVRQYLPDSFSEILPLELSSVAAVQQFLEKLPDELRIQESIDELRQFVEDWSGESADGELTLEELRQRVADLPDAAKRLVRLLRDRLPEPVKQLAPTILGEEEPVAKARLPRSGLWLFRIDPTAENPIEHVGTISHGEPVERSAQVGDTLFTISHDHVQAHLFSELGHELDALFIGRVTFDDFVTVHMEGGSQRIDVLANDQLPQDAKIVAVGEPTQGGTVAISDDGRSLLYTPAEKPPATVTPLVAETAPVSNAHDDRSLSETLIWPTSEATDYFSYTVELPDGSTEVATVNVRLVSEPAHDGRKMAQLAVADLAKRLNIDPDRVEVVRVESRTWPDSCLGMEHPDRACLTVITPGFIVWLTADQRRFEYHTDTNSTVMLVERKEQPEPAAVPDFFRVLQGSSANRFNVLANDFPGIHFIKAPEVTAVTTPSQGGAVTIAEGGMISYTPAAGFHGLETFDYVVDRGATATVTIEVLADDGGDDGTTGSKLVGIRLEVTDVTGNAVTDIELGEQFFVNVYVEDLRANPEGVFGAYLDVEFDSRLVKVAGDIENSDDYPNGVSGAASGAGIDELGGFTSSLRPLGADERLLVSIPLEALAVGSLTIATNPADLLPHHDSSIFGVNAAVPAWRIEYGSIDVHIVNDFHNEAEPTDANGDGITTPTDALPIINWINEHGAGSVVQLRDFERLNAIATTDFRRESRRFDTNGDGHCTHMDVLMIFNHVNEGSRQHVEAQAEADAPVLTLVAPARELPDLSTMLAGPPLPGSSSVARQAARLAAANAPNGIASGSSGFLRAEGEASQTSCPTEMESVLSDLADPFQQAGAVDDFFAELGLPS